MTRSLLLLALGLLLGGGLRAQPARFSSAELDALFDRPPRVEVNLGGALLRMAAAADDDPDTAGLIRGLRGLTVRVYSLAGARPDLPGRLDAFGHSLRADGWQTMVRVRPTEDDPDDVSIFVHEVGGAFDGMVVMALDADDDEASFVFLDGPIDLEHLSDLSDRFAGTDLDDASDDAERAREDARVREEDARIQREDERIRREDERRQREEDERLRREAPAPPSPPKRPAPSAP